MAALEATEPEPPSTRGRWTLFGGLAAVVTVLDQLSKAWVDAVFPLVPAASLDEPPLPTPVLGEFVRIAKTYNDGGIFGLFGDSAAVLASASIAVIALIVVYQARQGVASTLLTVALGLLLGGAIGNLLDRLRFGYVIDFVDIGIAGVRWYTFNVADAAISGAILLLILLSLFGDRLERIAARLLPRGLRARLGDVPRATGTPG